jgi:hypothetical protein
MCTRNLFMIYQTGFLGLLGIVSVAFLNTQLIRNGSQFK